MNARFIALPLALVLLFLTGCTNSPPSLRSINSFTAWKSYTETGTRYLEFQQSESGSLTNVDLIIRVRFEDGQQSEFNRQWPLWDKGEKKRIDVPGKASIQKWSIDGTATLNGEKVRCVAEFTPSTPDRRTVFAFKGSNGTTNSGTRYVEFSNSELGTLLNVDLTIRIHYEDGQKPEFKRQWPSWDKDERKRIELPDSKAAIQKYEFEGSATLNDEKVRCHAEYTVGPIGFDIQKSEGSLTHDVYCTFRGTVDLTDVSATLTIYYDNGKTPEVKRYWASVRPNEKKTINISAEGRIERVDLTGSAMVNGKKETFSFKTSW